MEPSDPQLDALLAYLKESRGFDFANYDRTTLSRRVDERMAPLGIETSADYLDHLQVHPGEFTPLFDAILSDETGFFRDAEVWECLRTTVMPPLIAGKPADSAIRIWSAGCGSGEEPYTLAMVLADALGMEAFRERVKIYATDVDEERLGQARLASYGEDELRDVPPDLAKRYFEVTGDRFTFRKDLRRSIIFGRNDLVQDAPISRVDLLVCRNTLMYFNADTQARILNRFDFALGNGGALFLGKADALLGHADRFEAIDEKWRLYRRRPRLAPFAGAPSPAVAEAGTSPNGLDQLRNQVLATSPLAELVLTSDGQVAITNRRLERLFGLSARDIGRPFRDLDLSYRPAELRSLIDRVRVERRVLHVTDIEHVHNGDVVYLDAEISPLGDDDGGLLGIRVTFHDITEVRRLRHGLDDCNQQLEAAYEELQSTNEELETTNEELQSTIEELETTNEELQSTNEELETMNEELQSTNDELQSINDQLRASTAELDEANAFLEAVLSGLHAGVAVVDRELRIRIWNRRAEDLWGVRPDEAVGQHFLNLDIGLPFETMRPVLRGALGPHGVAGATEVDAVNRRGRPVRIRVSCTPLGSPEGAIVLMESDEQRV